MSERERTAAALFGGPAPSRSQPKPRKRQPKKRGPKQPTKAAPAPQPAALDLFGDMSASTPAPEPAPAPKQPDGIDFLNNMFGGGGSNNNAPSSGGNDFMGMGSAPSSGGGLDLFGGGGSAPAASYGSAAMTPGIAQKIQQFPKSSSTDIKLVDTPQLQLATYNVIAPSSTFVMLFVSNKSQGALNKVEIKLQSPQCFRVQLQGDNAQRRTANKLTNIIIPSLAAQATSTQMVMLQCQHMSAVTIKSLRGQVSWQGVGPQPFAVTINTPDILRPLPIQTQQFGAFWKKCGKNSEVKFGMKSPINSSADVIHRIKNVVHIHHVQTIKTENICAGTLVSNKREASMACLVHAKLQQGGIIVLVRSASQQYSRLVAGTVKQAFS